MSTDLKELKDKIEKLPRADLEEIRSFVESLRARPGLETPRGSPERLLPLVGSLAFDEGELDDILETVQQSRDLGR